MVLLPVPGIDVNRIWSAIRVKKIVWSISCMASTTLSGKSFRSLDQGLMEGVYLGVQAPGFVLDQVRDRVVEVARPPFLANHKNAVAGMNAGTTDKQVSRTFPQQFVIHAHPGLLLASPGPHGFSEDLERDAAPAEQTGAFEGLSGGSPGIMSEASSAVMMVGALVLPVVRRGMIDASTTRRPSTPRTLVSASHYGHFIAAHLGCAGRMISGDRRDPDAGVNLLSLLRRTDPWRDGTNLHCNGCALMAGG